MSDKYTVPENASIFNLKRAYNEFTAAVVDSSFSNLFKNPDFKGLRNNDLYGWNPSLFSAGTASLLDGPVVEDIQGRRVMTWDQGLWMEQVVELELDQIYTLVIVSDSTVATNGNFRTQFLYGTDDLTDLAGAPVTAEIFQSETVTDEVFIQRFKTRSSAVDSTTLFNDDIKIGISSQVGVGTNQLILEKFYLIKGDIALYGTQDNEFLRSIRFADSTDGGAWEATVDGTNWTPFLVDDAAFAARVAEIAQAQNVDLIHQDNIIAGAGMTITPGVAGDGTTPTLTFESGGGGAGGGDWTREDVTYQSILEHSDYSYSYYDTFVDAGTVTLNGGANHSGVTDDFGTGKVQLSNTDSFETPDLIKDGTGNHSSFFFNIVTDINLDIDYATANDGTTWGAWTPFDPALIVYTPATFNNLKVRVTATSPFGNVYSFGVFYGTDVASAGNIVGFREPYVVPADATSGTDVEIPNDRWYHRDGVSLNVRYNRATLIPEVDYTEKNVGFEEKSNTVTFLIELEQDAKIEFEEIYGYVDISSDNAIRMDKAHYPSGLHKDELTTFYVDGTNGDDGNSGEDWANAWATIEQALARVDGMGITQIILKDSQNYNLTQTNSVNASLIITCENDGAGNPTSGTKPKVILDSYDEGGSNSWGSILMKNGTLVVDTVDVEIAAPFIDINPDTGKIGFPQTDALSKTTVFINYSTVNLIGSELFKAHANTQNIDYNIGNSTIDSDFTDRTFPIVDFSDCICGLFAKTVTLTGDNTAWSGTTVLGVIKDDVGSPINIRTNLTELSDSVTPPTPPVKTMVDYIFSGKQSAVAGGTPSLFYSTAITPKSIGNKLNFSFEADLLTTNGSGFIGIVGLYINGGLHRQISIAWPGAGASFLDEYTVASTASHTIELKLHTNHGALIATVNNATLRVDEISV